jgi:hypothetical protein
VLTPEFKPQYQKKKKKKKAKLFPGSEGTEIYITTVQGSR